MVEAAKVIVCKVQVLKAATFTCLLLRFTTPFPKNQPLFIFNIPFLSSTASLPLPNPTSQSAITKFLAYVGVDSNICTQLKQTRDYISCHQITRAYFALP